MLLNVWCVDLDCRPGTIDSYLRVLAPLERERSKRLVDIEARRQFVAARMTMRMILSGSLGCRPQDVHLAENAHGKPLVDPLRHHPAPAFNLSHDGDFGVMAVGMVADLGIDVLRLRPWSDVEAIVRHFFTRPEQAAVMELPLEKRAQAFARIWTRKEAVVKALGEGLSANIGAINVLGSRRALANASSSGPIPVVDGLFVYDVPLGGDRIASLATTVAVATIVTTPFILPDLMTREN